MKILALAFLELKKILHNKKNLVISIVIVLFWTLILVPGYMNEEIGGMDGFISNSVFFMATAVGIFICLMYSGAIFLNEKREKTVETLLCSPITLKEIWLSKTIAATIPAVTASWISSAILFISISIIKGDVTFPEPELAIYLVFLVPVILLSAIGLLGFFQFLFGMKENRIVSMLLMVALFAGLGGMTSISTQSNFVHWLTILVSGIVAFGLLALTGYLTRFLKKEKIVTTLEE